MKRKPDWVDLVEHFGQESNELLHDAVAPIGPVVGRAAKSKKNFGQEEGE